jgi:hypothetical protein
MDWLCRRVYRSLDSSFLGVIPSKGFKKRVSYWHVRSRKYRSIRTPSSKNTFEFILRCCRGNTVCFNCPWDSMGGIYPFYVNKKRVLLWKNPFHYCFCNLRFRHRVKPLNASKITMPTNEVFTIEMYP